MSVRGAGRPPVVAGWVRTRLRSAPGAAVAFAVLVAVTACLAAALPLAVDRYGDAGLRRALEVAGPSRTTVQLFATDDGMLVPQEIQEADLRWDAVRGAYTELLGPAGRSLPLDRDQSSYGVRTTDPVPVTDPVELARPSALPPQLHLVAQNDLAGHSRLRAGRLPKAPDGTGATAPSVEAAVTAETAGKLNITVGSVLRVPGPRRAPLTVRVTGVVDPLAPREAYWSTSPVLRSPHLRTVPDDPARSVYWVGALLLPPDAAPAILATGLPERYWNLAPDASALPAHDLPRLTSAVASLEAGPLLQQARAAVSPGVEADTALDEVFGEYGALRTAIGSLVAVAAFGTGTVAAVVLLMAGGLAADRRRAELTLLRARGASLRGLAARLLAETAVVAVPAAALGLTAALLLIPGARPAYAVAAAGAVAVVACAALPLRAVAAHRAVRVHAAREDVAATRPSRRRTVAELTLVAVAVGAVVALRTRGVSDGEEASGDALVSLAPVLVGMIAALVLVRLHPLPLRALAGPAGRLRGVVGPLSLARASRASGSAVLPLLALLTALTTAAFGGSVLTGVADARDDAALLSVGADARLEGVPELPPGLDERVRRAPGVEDVTAVAVAQYAQPRDGRLAVPVAAVDPAGYAALARHTDIGAFDADRLVAPADAGVLPALGSPEVAERYGTRPFRMGLGDGVFVSVRIVEVRERTPAVTGQEFLVVDRSGVPGGSARPTTLLVTGDRPDGHALREAADGDARVQLRAEEHARYADSPLQSGAERVYAAAVAAGAGYAVLALLLTLLRAAPERAALLARLRTMGLTRAQGRRLLVLESLPQALLAAAGGTVTAWAAIRLLSPGIDLTTIAVSASSSPAGRAVLRTDPVSLLVPALAVLALAVGIAAAQAWWSGRAGSVRELRAGDAR
ncbi:membrane protein [Streptomyces pilosus]|uniref:ABC transporter permease n=1 Tax=Streptomyces pilosus TaxID=28893 RepID=UPI0019BCAAD4|nr:ABC transporter permease [Streptomyces pilosus]GGV34342.1 membrane protein [Streptomyces pilosus]